MYGLAELCPQYPSLQTCRSIMEQVTEVKNIMTENIEKVLERGEHLEVLVDKTEDLRSQVRLGSC